MLPARAAAALPTQLSRDLSCLSARPAAADSRACPSTACPSTFPSACPSTFPSAAMSGAKYALVFDPLDGSSNIDCNVSVGSIFGIYRRPGFEPGSDAKAESEPKGSDVLQPGRNLVAAGYCMYGSSTEMVLCFGKGSASPAAGGAGAGAAADASVGAADGGVHVFSLDPATGEFMLTRRNLRMPEKPQRIYSCNEGNYAAFPRGFQRFLDEAKKGDKPYSLRYVGSMVAGA